jgi:hypothetical protein
MKAESPSYTASVPMGERDLPENVPEPEWAREPQSRLPYCLPYACNRRLEIEETLI